MNDLQNQESLSFSTSSRVELLSNNEDGSVDDHHHTRRRVSYHRQKDYLEISLPQPPLSSSALIAKTNQNDEKEEEFEFCFSFNSSSTLLDFPVTPVATSNHPFHNHDPPMSTSTCETYQVIDVVYKKYNHHDKSNYKHIFHRVTSPRRHQWFLSPCMPRTSIEARGATRSRRSMKNLSKLENRNSARCGGIRKIVVKLRSIKSMLGSSLNLYRRQQSSHIDKLVKKTTKTFTDDKLIKIDLQRNYGLMTSINNKFITNTHNLNRNKKKKSFRMMKFDGFSKIMDVIMKNIRITRSSKQMGSKSCPISIKSSLVHNVDERRNSSYLRDHSIKGAIAHCKKSFGK